MVSIQERFFISRRKKIPTAKRTKFANKQTLNLVLAGESAEPVLRELIVCVVEPNPDSAHLLVIVEGNLTGVPLDENEVLEALKRAEGRLRSALATAINRKRTPQISFRFIASTGVPQ